MAVSGMPSRAAISRMGSIFACCAISISLGTAFFFASGATAPSMGDLLREHGKYRKPQNGRALTRVKPFSAMHPHETLIRDFYSAFARRDAEAMAGCYHRD